MNSESGEAENDEFTKIDNQSDKKSFDFLVLPSVVVFLFGMIGWNWLVGIVSTCVVSIILVVGGFRKSADKVKLTPILVIIFLSVFISYVGIVYYQFKYLNDRYVEKSMAIVGLLSVAPGVLGKSINRYENYAGRDSEIVLFENTINKLDKDIQEIQKKYQDDNTPEALNVPVVLASYEQCQNENVDALRELMNSSLDYVHGKINGVGFSRKIDEYNIYSGIGAGGGDVGKCQKIISSTDNNLKKFGMCLFTPCKSGHKERKWEIIGVHTEGDYVNYYVDSSSIKKNGNTGSIWIMFDLKDASELTGNNPEKYLSNTNEYEVDCARKRVHSVSFHAYSENKANGKLVFENNNQNGPWQSFNPDIQLWELMWKKVCLIN
jgi:hypothetical protein